jgi:hypothetical protein
MIWLGADVRLGEAGATPAPAAKPAAEPEKPAAATAQAAS